MTIISRYEQMFVDFHLKPYCKHLSLYSQNKRAIRRFAVDKQRHEVWRLRRKHRPVIPAAEQRTRETG